MPFQTKTDEDIQVLIKKLAGSINPATGKKYTNPEIVEEVHSITGKTISRRTASTYSGREKVKGETIDEVKKFLSENNLSTDGTDKQLRKRKYNFVQQLRKNSSKEVLIPVNDYFYEDELIDFRKRGLSIDSPEVQKFIDKRTKGRYNNLKKRSKVFSYETVDGLPDGEIKPESKKLVASLFEDSDAEDIRALVRDVIEKQTRIFFQEGKLPDVDDLDHIFPHGSVKIINGKLVGGAFSPDGVFQGVGLTNRKNLQALSKALNRSSQNILTPEKLAQLGVGEFKPSTPEGSLARILQLGQWQRGETDASGKPVRKPRARYGKFFNFAPGVGMATLPLWLLAPNDAQAMVDEGKEIISNALPEGLLNFGSKADNAISKTFDMFGANNTASLIPNPMAAMQWLYEGGKQAIPETIGLLNAIIDTPESPEKNLSRLERLRLMQSGRSY